MKMEPELELSDAEYPSDRHLGLTTTDMTGFNQKPVHMIICVRNYFRDNWVTLDAPAMRKLRDWLTTVLTNGGENENPLGPKQEAPEC